MIAHRIARVAGIALAGGLLAAIPASGAASRPAARAIADAVHPWHDAIAEARVIEAESRLEVAMRVDAAHLEAMISARTERSFDLDQAREGSEIELRLAAIVRAGMEARFAPAADDPAGTTPPDDRFDFHWLGRELEGSDCWLYFEWVAPPGDGATRRPVQIRSTLLIEPSMRQVNTVSILGHGSAGFDADRTDWADVDLQLRPRKPGPLRVARAGADGPRILVVSGLGSDGDLERRIAGRLRDVARVEVAFWPGLDGSPPPPTALPVGGWARWTGEALRRRIAADPADPPAIVVLIGRASELTSPNPTARDHAPEFIVVDGPRTQADEGVDARTEDLFARSITSRFRRDLDAIQPNATTPVRAAASAAIGRDADAVAARVRARIQALPNP